MFLTQNVYRNRNGGLLAGGRFLYQETCMFARVKRGCVAVNQKLHCRIFASEPIGEILARKSNI